MEIPDLPEGWRLKSIIEQDGLWKVYAYSATEYCSAAGTNPRYAVLDAIKRIEDGAVHAILSGHRPRQEPNLTELLQIPKPKIDRRD